MQIPHRGVNIAQLPESLHDIQDIMRYLNELKFSWVRLEFDYLNPLDSTYMTELVTELYKGGYSIMGTLLSLTPGTIDSLYFPSKIYSAWHSYEYDKFIKFSCTTISQFYQVSIRQIGNEWNTRRFRGGSPDPQLYYSMYKNIVNIFPNHHIVIGPVFDNLSIFSDLLAIHVSLDRLLQSSSFVFGGNDIALHPYIDHCYISTLRTSQSYTSRIIHNISKMKNNIVSSLGHKQLWITEFGISRLWTSISIEELSLTYVRMLQYCDSQGIPFFLWNMFNFPSIKHHLLNPERYFGLVSDDGMRTPLYYALGNTLDILYPDSIAIKI